jgi:hypothetical protein
MSLRQVALRKISLVAGTPTHSAGSRGALCKQLFRKNPSSARSTKPPVRSSRASDSSMHASELLPSPNCLPSASNAVPFSRSAPRFAPSHQAKPPIARQSIKAPEAPMMSKILSQPGMDPYLALSFGSVPIARRAVHNDPAHLSSCQCHERTLG